MKHYIGFNGKRIYFISRTEDERYDKVMKDFAKEPGYSYYEISEASYFLLKVFSKGVQANKYMHAGVSILREICPF